MATEISNTLVQSSRLKTSRFNREASSDLAKNNTQHEKKRKTSDNACSMIHEDKVSRLDPLPCLTLIYRAWFHLKQVTVGIPGGCVFRTRTTRDGDCALRESKGLAKAGSAPCQPCVDLVSSRFLACGVAAIFSPLCQSHHLLRFPLSFHFLSRLSEA